jgi:predicted transcriptional regulator
MDVLYELGGATAVQIRERMADPPTDSAVRSILRILVNKRHLERTPEGHRYVYSPTMPVVRARRSAMHRVLRTFFGGSVEGAVAMLLELGEGDLTPDDRERIKRMIDEAEEDGR